MKVFVCTDHNHHNPVGVASVIVAADDAAARQLLEQELEARGLGGGVFSLQEIAMEPAAHILCDAEY